VRRIVQLTRADVPKGGGRKKNAKSLKVTTNAKKGMSLGKNNIFEEILAKRASGTRPVGRGKKCERGRR